MYILEYYKKKENFYKKLKKNIYIYYLYKNRKSR